MPITMDIGEMMQGGPGIAPAALQILHIVTKTLPGFRFEYHPRVRKVYMVRIGATPEIGELLAAEIPDADHAKQVVQAFRAGYLAARAPVIGA